MAKPPFNYKSESLDEKEIDKILSKRRCDVVVARVDSASLGLTPKERKEFFKRNPPTKKTAKPVDTIVRKLASLVNNKNIREDHRRKYAADLDFYRTMQKESRPPTGGKKMFLEYVKRDEVKDIVDYIFNIRGGRSNQRLITLVKCFDLAAQVFNDKRNGSITAKTVKTLYWNALKSKPETSPSENP